jgi:hypothetical protein
MNNEGRSQKVKNRLVKNGPPRHKRRGINRIILNAPRGGQLHPRSTRIIGSEVPGSESRLTGFTENFDQDKRGW